MTDSINQDPAAIESDIRRTQDKMSQTVDKIGEQFTIKNLFNAMLDKADENNVDARTLYDGARRNPIALGLIAAGAIWLVSDKDSKIPSIGKDKSGGRDFDDSDTHHRDYVSHMSSIEQKADEDQAAFQRRRDLARSNFLMVERKGDEDESAFRERLDGMTDKFREKRRAWADSAAQATDATVQGASRAVDATKRSAGRAADKAGELYNGNPLVGGIIAAAVGAAFGTALPITRQEQDKLGAIGEKTRDVVGQQTDQLTSQLREKKDELLDKADEKLQSVGATSGPMDKPAGGSGPDDSKPFIARS